jgi:hypothetical protein
MKYAPLSVPRSWLYAFQAFLIKEDVLGLEISVNYPVRMQVLDGHGDLSNVELGSGFGEPLLPSKQYEELASLDEFHYEVNSLRNLNVSPSLFSPKRSPTSPKSFFALLLLEAGPVSSLFQAKMQGNS